MDIIEEKCDGPEDEDQLKRFETLARRLGHGHQLRDELFDILKRIHWDTSQKDATAASDKYLLAIKNIKIQDEHYAGLSFEEMLKDSAFRGRLLAAPEINEILDSPTEVPASPKSAPIIEETSAQLADLDMPPLEDHEFTVPALSESAPGALDQPESQILRRVNELKREGLWSDSRLPLCVEPLRNKTHWDYLLEEVVWMAHDFHQERRTKISDCRRLSTLIARKIRFKNMKIERTGRNDMREAKRHCAIVAKLVKDFWQNVNKVVDYKAQEILDCRKRKALDEQLNFIVGQADKLSTMVKEGLSKREHSLRPITRSWGRNPNRDQVVPEIEKESDNESTMSEEEKQLRDSDEGDELAALASEAAKGYEELLAELPQAYLALHGLPVPASKQVFEKPSIEGNGDGRGTLKDVNYDKLNSLKATDREQELEQIAEQVMQFLPKGHTLETTQVKTPVPLLIRGTLREYQMVGLDWLVTLYEKNLNGILADEMGLGKTIQTIALLAHLAGAESCWGPHLIIVPTSVILNWEMELKKWCPALKILTYFGTVKERAEKRKGWLKENNFHVVIGSYQTVTQDIRSFKSRHWQYMILDEAQNIKNWKSKRWQSLLNIKARRRLLLTGTPLQNSLMELWSLMHFLMPSIFGSHNDFKDWFHNPLTGMMEGSVEYNGALVDRLHKILRPFILRRMKNEVEKQLPAKTEHVVPCQLSKRQRFLYDDFMSRRSTKNELKAGNTLSVLGIVMQLRKCCNHPNLFEPRSVQTPLVSAPIRKYYPAMFLDLVDPESTKPEPIPDCLDLRRRLLGHSLYSDVRISKIKELKQTETAKRPPMIPGFHLTVVARPLPPLKVSLKADRKKEAPKASTSDRSPVPKRRLDLNPSFKSYTATFPCPRQPVEVDGFNRMMAESGAGEKYKFSSPLKLRKRKEVESPYSSLVPEYAKAGWNERKSFQLKLAGSRFEAEVPLMAQEMVESVQLSTTWPIDIHSGLREQEEAILKKFSVFVDPVEVDTPTVTTTSSGRSVHASWTEKELKRISRRYLEQSDHLVSNKLLASRLQFPETRLIEYDCGKLQTLALLLRQLHLYKHRCLIFTQMSRMLDILQAFLSHHGYTYFRLDGSTGIEQRQQLMEQFNADSRIFCFILSTRSGGVGVNLTGADTVIFYDSDWNPTMDAQAQDRCHRIGQTKDVTIYRLISESTIEENILKKARQKRRLGEMAIDEAGFTPEFFQQPGNIRDLFEGQTTDMEIGSAVKTPVTRKQLENAMAEMEDDQDRAATKKAAAEAGIDTAEFLEADKEKTSMRFTGNVDPDDKYIELLGQLKPIERYAVQFLMDKCMPELEEPTRQKSIAESEDEHSGESTPELEEDIYTGGSSLDEIETFPDVNPPCPFTAWYPYGPSDEGDIYYNICLDSRYERQFMEDARLPTRIHDFPIAKRDEPPKETRPLPPFLVEPAPIPKKKKKTSAPKGRSQSVAVMKTKSSFLDDVPLPKKKVRKSAVEASESVESSQLVKIRKQDAERQNKNIGSGTMTPTMPKTPIFPHHLWKKTPQPSQEPLVAPPPQYHGPKTNIPPKQKISLSPLDDIMPPETGKVVVPTDPRLNRPERLGQLLGPSSYSLPWQQKPVYLPSQLVRMHPPPPEGFVLPQMPHHGPRTNIPPKQKISLSPLDDIMPPETRKVVLPTHPRLNRTLPRKTLSSTSIGAVEKSSTLSRVVPMVGEVRPQEYARLEQSVGPFLYPPPAYWPPTTIFPPPMYRVPPPKAFVLPPMPPQHGPRTNISQRMKTSQERSQTPGSQGVPAEDDARRLYFYDSRRRR